MKATINTKSGLIKSNWGIILGGTYYLLFTFYNLTTTPYLDSNFDFIKSQRVYHQGLLQVIANYGSNQHPPLKDLLLQPLYLLVPDPVVAYHLLPLFFISLALVFGKKVGELLFNNSESGNLTAALIGTSPLLVTTGVLVMPDFLVACLIPVVFYLLLTHKTVLAFILVGVACLVKETAIGLVPGLVVIQAAHLLVSRKPQGLFRLGLLTLIPISILTGWRFLAGMFGGDVWFNYVFAESAKNTDPFLFVIKNLLTLNIINSYFLENLKHLLVLNFNWIYTLLGLVLVPTLLFTKTKVRTVAWFLILATLISYSVVVLSFPTYSIPRYTAPVLIILYLLTSGLVWFTGSRTIVMGLLVLQLVAGLVSIDPISHKVWGSSTKTGQSSIFGEQLYALNPTLSGNDRITYNLQYLIALQRRDAVLNSIQSDQTMVASRDCTWLFRDPINDLTTFNLLHTQQLSKLPICEWEY